MIENEEILKEFVLLEELTNTTYANHVMMNSLKMLGAKKAQSRDVLTEADYKLLNNYKYPERLVKMMNWNSARFEAEGSFAVSFTKIALDSHDIKF